jgi:cyanophycin synthetase
VLNADDPLVAEMAARCSGEVIFCTRLPNQALIQSHLRAGGRAVCVRDSRITLATGGSETSLMSLDEAPLTHGGRIGFQVENTLAAVAAAWALAIPPATIRSALASFVGDDVQAPGRFNVLRQGNKTLVVDYAHNLSAMKALLAAVETFSHRRRTLVFGGFNRSDAEIIEIGRIIGDAFDQVALYVDCGNRDRSDGELSHLLSRGLAVSSRVWEVITFDSEGAAISQAIQSQQAEDLLVIGIESVEQSLSLIRRAFSQPEGKPDAA